MNKGFTILEVIVAIFVLTVGVGGSFVLIQQTLIAASLAQSTLTAHYLAQEGIEIVRNIRDTNWLKQRSGVPDINWDSNIDINDNLEIGGPAGIYIVDYKDVSLEDFVEDKPLNLVNGFYSYDSPGIPTPFKRTIYVSKKSITGPDNYRLLVNVRVDWSERGRDHWVEASEYLYNWGEGYY